MKRGLGLLFIVVFMVLLCGCKKEEKETGFLPASKENFRYEGTEGTDCVAVDEEGLLYTMAYIRPESKGPVVVSEGSEDDVRSNPLLRICIYDLEGSCIEQKELTFGNGQARAMLIEDGVLYCVLGKSMREYNREVLFAVDTKTWEVTALFEFPEDYHFSYMVHVGGYVYLLGQDMSAKADATEAPDTTSYAYRNNKICRINIHAEEPKSESMNVEYPIAIYGTAQDTLMVYRYTLENGYGFLEFDPAQDTLTEAGWRKMITIQSCFSGCGEGYLCFERGLQGATRLFYSTLDGKEADIYPDGIWMTKPAVYKKGFVFLINQADGYIVERICVEQVVREDGELQFLMDEEAQELPYGCGFLMEKNGVSAAEFALKVLAQDTDFDICLLSTRKGISDNIRRNGVFYPLNEVDGVQEYLDACFPYVKDVATNADGDIWMIPVALSVPGLVYNREFCEKNGVDYSEMDLAGFLDFTAPLQETHPEQVSISSYVLRESLFGQYLSVYDSFDTAIFRRYAKQIKRLYDEQGTWYFSFAANEALRQGEIPEFYFSYNVYSGTFSDYAEELGDSDAVGIAELPTIEDGVRNAGTVTFLAVNPESANLEAALNYISAFAKHMLTRRDSFLLADESTYTDTPFVRDWYRLYAGGTVYFQMSGEVYLQTFNDYLEGSIGLEEAIAEMERKRKVYMGE